MAAPTLPFITVEEYLNSSYHPDREYVEGVLVERTVPTILHSILQLLLGTYFRQFEPGYKFKTLIEARTQIVQRARYRIPDVSICPLPLSRGKIVDTVPLAVFEILSPDDTITATLQRFRDYERLGVHNIVQMDPEQCIAHRFQSGSLLETKFTTLHLPNTGLELPFDSEALFSQLREEHDAATG